MSHLMIKFDVWYIYEQAITMFNVALAHMKFFNRRQFDPRNFQSDLIYMFSR